MKKELDNMKQLEGERKDNKFFVKTGELLFNIGDRVDVSHHGSKNGVVIDRTNDGYYLVRYDYVQESRGKIIPYFDVEKWFVEPDIWFDKDNAPRFSCDKTIWEQYNKFANRKTIDNFLVIKNHFGMNLNPSYQRDFVWTEQQQEDLITAIFNKRDIGTIHLLSTSDHQTESYEVLDGKQRMTTIFNFITGKMKYKGFYFYEMCKIDRMEFLRYAITYTEIARYDEKDFSLEEKINLFIEINDTGTPISREHLFELRRKLKGEN